MSTAEESNIMMVVFDLVLVAVIVGCCAVMGYTLVANGFSAPVAIILLCSAVVLPTTVIESIQNITRACAGR